MKATASTMARSSADAETMRDKLAAQFPASSSWDIKFARGGLVDIEFIAQSMQLAFASKHPEVLDQNTISALTKLGDQGIIGYEDAQARQIFRDLIDTPADVKISKTEITVRFHRRAHLPIILPQVSSTNRSQCRGGTAGNCA